jgi:hypothetical protein
MHITKSGNYRMQTVVLARLRAWTGYNWRLIRKKRRVFFSFQEL